MWIKFSRLRMSSVARGVKQGPTVLIAFGSARVATVLNSSLDDANAKSLPTRSPLGHKDESYFVTFGETLALQRDLNMLQGRCL